MCKFRTDHAACSTVAILTRACIADAVDGESAGRARTSRVSEGSGFIHMIAGDFYVTPSSGRGWMGWEDADGSALLFTRATGKLSQRGTGTQCSLVRRTSPVDPKPGWLKILSWLTLPYFANIV